MADWKNRIVGHGEESPEQLLANPKNWRTHPKEQREALAGAPGDGMPAERALRPGPFGRLPVRHDDAHRRARRAAEPVADGLVCALHTAHGRTRFRSGRRPAASSAARRGSPSLP